MTSANTEYTLVIPAGAQTAVLQCRTADDVRIAFVTGKVAGPTAPYFTLKAGQTFPWVRGPDMGADAVTVYCACGSAGKVLECAVGKAG